MTTSLIPVSSFADAVFLWMDRNPHRIDDLAERFDSTVDDVIAWSLGTKEPLLIVQKLVTAWVEEHP